VRVALAAVDDNGKPLADPVFIGIAKTDASGNYRLEAIPRGRYALVAGAVAGPTYYPGTSKPEEARLVTVTPGMPPLGFDFDLVTALSVPSPRLQGNGLRSMHGIAIYDVPGRLVIEGGGTVQSVSGMFVLTMTGSPGKFETTLEDNAGAFRIAEAKWDPAGNALSLVAGVDVRADGGFYLSLPDGIYNLAVARKPGLPNSGPGYYVKSVQMGPVDLLKTTAKLPAVAGVEVVVTLGKCSTAIAEC